MAMLVEYSATRSVPAPPIALGGRARRFTLDLVSSVAGLERLRPDYAGLLRLTNHPLPFAQHEWHICWCVHFLQLSGDWRDHVWFYVLRDALGACVAIVPMVRMQRRVGPMTVETLDALGADPGVTELRAPLIARGYEATVARLVQLRLQGDRWDWVCWRGLDPRFSAALADCCPRVRWQPPVLDYLIDLPQRWEDLSGGVKRNIRESLGHCYSALRRDGYSFTPRVAADPAAVRAALERLLPLEAKAAGLVSDDPRPERFASQTVRRFLHDVCARLAARGLVRVFELAIDGEVVAARLGFVVGNSLYLYCSGFDARWTRYGVAGTTMAEAIRHAIALKLASVNLGPGADVAKLRWDPRAVAYGEAVQVGRSVNAHVSRVLHEHPRSSAGSGLSRARMQRRGQLIWTAGAGPGSP